MTKKRILIVEDHGVTALDEMVALRELGYEVTGIAMTGEDAVRHADQEKPDAILMDINLAGKMDGREAARNIHEKHQIPVVFVTASGGVKTPQTENFTAPEGFGYVFKPFNKVDLAAELKRLIG